MKILILGFAKIKYMPYLNLYLDNIDTNKNEVHVLYWNRDLQFEDIPQVKNVIWHEFKCYQEDEVSPITKIGSFIKFRKFTKSVVRKEKFDFVIALTSVLAVLVSDLLIGKYKNRFFFDYRDVTYERLPLYKILLWTIVKNSRKTFISSNAFRGYFPQSQQEKIYLTCNFLPDSLDHREDKELYGIKSDKIRIAFWGVIRNEEINRKIIERVSNDERFELHYYGREQGTAKKLKSYAEKICAENVFFHGEYAPEERYAFVKNTDIIHNIYDDNKMMLAMGNKFYDGLIFRIPQICTEGSFMGKTAEKFGVGKAVNPNEVDFTTSVFDYFKALDEKCFFDNCNNALDQVLEDNKKSINYIKATLN